MSDIQADLPALERFAATSMDRHEEFDHLRSRMDAVRLPRESFGYIPGIGDRVHDAYEEFVTGCADAILSAAETMASVAAAVRGAITAYTTTDNASAASLQVIESEMSDVNLRGPK